MKFKIKPYKVGMRAVYPSYTADGNDIPQLVRMLFELDDQLEMVEIRKKTSDDFSHMYTRLNNEQ